MSEVEEKRIEDLAQVLVAWSEASAVIAQAFSGAMAAIEAALGQVAAALAIETVDKPKDAIEAVELRRRRIREARDHARPMPQRPDYGRRPRPNRGRR